MFLMWRNLEANVQNIKRKIKMSLLPAITEKGKKTDNLSWIFKMRLYMFRIVVQLLKKKN